MQYRDQQYDSELLLVSAESSNWMAEAIDTRCRWELWTTETEERSTEKTQ